MELRDFFFDCLEGRDASSFEECVHEDFIYIRETEMFTRDEFRSEVIEEFVQGVMISKNLQVLFENDKIHHPRRRRQTRRNPCKSHVVMHEKGWQIVASNDDDGYALGFSAPAQSYFRALLNRIRTSTNPSHWLIIPRS